MKAQVGYYDLPSAAEVLSERIRAIADALPKTKRLLDLGCNDGSIAKSLLSLGITENITGLDLENLTGNTEPRLNFIQGDLNTFDLTLLPPADGVLILNVIHHIIARSRDRAVQIINCLLDNYKFVIIDLGSKTEIGDWEWRARYEELYRDDVHLWDDLFGQAEWRFKLLRYPAQGGHRVIWKLYRHQYILNDLRIEDILVRNIGSWSQDKVLVSEAKAGSLEISPTVSYQVLRSTNKDRFFRKVYSAEANPLLAEYEYKIGNLAQKALDDLDKFDVEERFRIKVSKPIDYGPGNCVTFLYEPDMTSAKPIHYQDWQVFLTPEDSRAAFIFACAIVDPIWCPPVQILNLADFQCALSWDGLRFLDFEPNALVLEYALAMQTIQQQGLAREHVQEDTKLHIEAAQSEEKIVGKNLIENNMLDASPMHSPSMLTKIIELDPFSYWPDRGSKFVRYRRSYEVKDDTYVFHTSYVFAGIGQCIARAYILYTGGGELVNRVHELSISGGSQVKPVAVSNVKLSYAQSPQEQMVEISWHALSSAKYALLTNSKNHESLEIISIKIEFSIVNDINLFQSQVETLIESAKRQYSRNLQNDKFPQTRWDAPSLAHPSSQMCTSAQFEEDNYRYWCESIKQRPRLHRKQWEFVYIMEVLKQCEMLQKGRKGVGFGVGVEPLPALMASYGVQVLGTDLSENDQRAAAWSATNQHSKALSGLRRPQICSDKYFDELVSFEAVDMNNIPNHISNYDFTWSSCCYEHLGSIHRGLSFVENSLNCLRPGGIAVHTTELNLTSNSLTVDHLGTVLFRISDFIDIYELLTNKGHKVWTLNFHPGDGLPDKHIDIPPYSPNEHLKLVLGGYVTTSFGIVIQKSVNMP